jgi:hypothetical protein
VEAIHQSLQVGPTLLFFFHLAISTEFGERSCHGVAGRPSGGGWLRGGAARWREPPAAGGWEDSRWIRHRNEEREKLLGAVVQRWIRQQEPPKTGVAGASRRVVGDPSALAVAPAIPAAPYFCRLAFKTEIVLFFPQEPKPSRHPTLFALLHTSSWERRPAAASCDLDSRCVCLAA